MKYPEQGLLVTQTAEIVPGQTTRLLDTCLVRYRIENVGNTSRKVGIRVLVDTFIVRPFLVPAAAMLFWGGKKEEVEEAEETEA